MNTILSQETSFREVAYLQSADDVNRFELDRIISIARSDESFDHFDYYLATYDYTDEMPEQKSLTFADIFLDSVIDYYETLHYLVLINVFGHYAIYRKAWL